MKVLTAAALDGDNRVAGDFCHATPGEITIPNPYLCDRAVCDCTRSAMGLTSRRRITTVRVADRDLTDGDVTALLNAYNQQTWDGRLAPAVLTRWWDTARRIAEAAPAAALIRLQAADGQWRAAAVLIPTPPVHTPQGLW